MALGWVRGLVAIQLQCYLYAFGVTFSLSEPILSIFIISFLRFFEYHLLCIKTLIPLNLEKNSTALELLESVSSMMCCNSSSSLMIGFPGQPGAKGDRGSPGRDGLEGLPVSKTC